MFKCIHCDFQTDKDFKYTRHINRKIPCSKSMKQERERKQQNSDVGELTSEFSRNTIDEDIGDTSNSRVEPSIRNRVESSIRNRVEPSNPNGNHDLNDDNDYDDNDSDDGHPPEGMETLTSEIAIINDVIKYTIYNLMMYQNRYFREYESFEDEVDRMCEFNKIIIPLRCMGDVGFWRKINREARKKEADNNNT